MCSCYLSIKSTKTKIVSSAYSSEGVPTLDVHGWQSQNFEASLFIATVPQSLRSKVADFGPFHGLLTQHSSQQVVIPMCQYDGFVLAPFVAVATTQSEAEFHIAFSHCYILTNKDSVKMASASLARSTQPLFMLYM